MGYQDNGWIEAGAGGDQVWKPEQEGDSITGLYVKLETGVGINKSNIYSLQEDGKDEPTSVWGSTVLDARFEEIEISSMVQIEFLGTKKGSGPKPYKNYRVLYKPAVEGDIPTES